MNMVEHRTEGKHGEPHFPDQGADYRYKYDEVFRAVEYTAAIQAFHKDVTGFHSSLVWFDKGSNNLKEVHDTSSLPGYCPYYYVSIRTELQIGREM